MSTMSSGTLIVSLVLSGFAVVRSEDCWWSGCQPDSWAQKGCFPADQWQQVSNEYCRTDSGQNGNRYKCCKKTSGGDGGNPMDPGSCFVTKDEFVRGETINGYSPPRDDQYTAMCSQARSAGGIASKQELAMFMAQITHESGGLQYKKEIRCIHTGCPGEYDNSVGEPGRNYYGRGYIQLTHSYNYKAASLDLYNDLRLIYNPDLVSDDENVAWAVTFWFWKTRVRTQPNVLDFWFGAATNAINGALECRGSNQAAAHKRFELYRNILIAYNIHVNPIEKGCYN